MRLKGEKIEMPVFTRHEIDNLGFKAAKELEQGTPLHSSIVKMARDNSMNPEQIKRLVESANTTAFLNKFKEKTGNQRMVEFDVADPRKVVDEAIGSASTGTPGNADLSITITVSNGDNSSMHDTVMDENTMVDKSAYSDKVASYGELPTLKFASLGGSSEVSLSSYNKYKIKDSLLTKIADYNYRASDLADDIASEFKGIYTQDKYAGLELDALSSYGNTALPALQMIRTRLGMAKISNVLSPQQEYYLQDRHIVQSSKNLDKVASIIELCKAHGKVANSLKNIESL